MKILLDTHILLWATSEPSKLSLTHREMIADPNNIVFISVATLWELTIKQTINKITLPNSFLSIIKNSGYEILKIEVHHIEKLASLPLHHRDPFDRIIIAQAKVEAFTLLTIDKDILKYYE